MSDIVERIRSALAEPNHTLRECPWDWLEEAADEIERLRKGQTDSLEHWFYLHCHPEDVKAVVREVLFGEVAERDGAGHVRDGLDYFLSACREIGLSPTVGGPSDNASVSPA